MTNTSKPKDLRRLAKVYRDVTGWAGVDSFRLLAAAWEADLEKLNSETARADAAELRAAALEQRDETETMNIGAALFAVVLRDDDGKGEMPAGPCADVLREWRGMRTALMTLPADDIDGSTLEWFASKFETKLGHAEFGQRLRNYAAEWRKMKIDGVLNGDEPAPAQCPACNGTRRVDTELGRIICPMCKGA